MRDTSVDGLIRKGISARMQESPDGCPDENMMAAYLEGNLSDPETTAYESHLAECSSCQETLALALKIQDTDASVQESLEPAAGKKVLFRFSIPIPVLGAVCVAIIVGAVLFRVIHNSGEKTAVPQSAELHLPARSAEPATAPQKAESVVRPAPAPAPSDFKDGALAENPPDQPLSYENRKKVEPQVAIALPPAAPMVQDEAAMPSKAPAEKETVAEAPAAREELKAAAAPAPRADRDQASRMRASAPSVAVLGGSAKAQSNTAGSRVIGDKEFYSDAGFWIDQKCAGRQGEPIIEIVPADPEYEAILERYKELRSLRPFLIYWKGRVCLLR